MKTDILVVGGGLVGLSIAFHLARFSTKNITVVDRAGLNYGSSTRNASHFRVHFGAPENTRFAIQAVKRLYNLPSLTGWNPIAARDGYVWLIYHEEQWKAFEKANQMWKSLGVSGKLLESEEVARRWPYLNMDGIIGGFYGPQNGRGHHDSIAYGFYHAASRLGVKFLENTEVIRMNISGSRLRGVDTTATSPIEAETVVVAGGAYTGTVMKMAGVNVPVEPERREICVSEPVKFFLKPLTISMNDGFYAGQMVRGEIVMSMGLNPTKGFSPLENRVEWLRAMSFAGVRLIPSFRNLRIIRTWSGYYDMSPDHSQIMGRDPAWPEGLFVASGFSGHGFMMSTFSGELMAKHILENQTPDLMKPFLPTRFNEGKLINEALVMSRVQEVLE